MTFDELTLMLIRQITTGEPVTDVWLGFGDKEEPMKKPSKMQAKIGKVMHEYKAGDLHSGSKKGPTVTSRKQAIAIGISEGRKASRKK